jgi:hypothetical protein
MLVYHPAYDAYHCLFRLLTILEERPRMEMDRLRILDFVLCFPTVVATFKLPQRSAGLRKPAKLADNAYRTPMSPKATFLTLTASQDGAISCLAAANFVAPNSLPQNSIERTLAPLPQELRLQANVLRAREALFFEQILPALFDLPLLGPDGLKARSGLIEYRYDTLQA